jgi:integrase
MEGLDSQTLTDFFYYGMMLCSLSHPKGDFLNNGFASSTHLKHLEEYLHKCLADRLKQETIRDKKRHLLLYFSKYKTITTDNIYAFLNSLNVTPVVERKIRKDLRAYIKFLNENNLCSIPYTTIKNTPDCSKLRPMVLEEEFRLMLYKCDELIIKDESYLLWKAVVQFLWDTGLRRGELVRIKLKDVDFNEKTFYVLTEKTQKWRQGWFDCDLSAYLSAYSPTDRLFPISDKSVGYIVRKLKKLCNIQRDISAHSFRHSYATNLIESGANIVDVAHLCGHTAIQTTMIYAHSVNLKEVYKKHKSRLNK